MALVFLDAGAVLRGRDNGGYPERRFVTGQRRVPPVEFGPVRRRRTDRTALLESPPGRVTVNLRRLRSAHLQRPRRIREQQDDVRAERFGQRLEAARQQRCFVFGRRQGIRERMQLARPAFAQLRLGGLRLEPHREPAHHQRYQKQRGERNQVVGVFDRERVARRDEEEIKRDNADRGGEQRVPPSEAECREHHREQISHCLAGERIRTVHHPGRRSGKSRECDGTQATAENRKTS